MAKKAASNLVNMLLALTLIAFVASLALAMMNKATKETIELNDKKKVDEAVLKVLPHYRDMEAKADTLIVDPKKTVVDTVKFVRDVKGKEVAYALTRYTAYDAEGVLVGKAIESFDGNGFGGKLRAMVGFDAEGNITGYEILESSETPGLGAKADKWFQTKENGGKGGGAQVIGLNPAVNKIMVSNGKGDEKGEVDAITGSTITSKAFCRLVDAAYEAFIFGNDAEAEEQVEGEGDVEGEAVADGTEETQPADKQ